MRSVPIADGKAARVHAITLLAAAQQSERTVFDVLDLEPLPSKQVGVAKVGVRGRLPAAGRLQLAIVGSGTKLTFSAWYAGRLIDSGTDLSF